MTDWVYPSGTAARDGRRIAIDDATPGWRHTGLHVVELDTGAVAEFAAGAWEYVVVPLRGGAHIAAVDADGRREYAELTGRADVFAGPTDVVFAPAGSALTITATGTSVIAVCAANLGDRTAAAPFQYVPAADVPVELRGAGVASRQVRNFGVPGVLDADRIIACEVITPGGNWSSWPPHKHDEERPGVETELEEIYYFEVQAEAGAPASATDPIGYQRVYGTAERPIEVLAEVRSGDVVLVPHGWHGPAMAAPGYDLYYLNVMAGPGETRAWLICDDPNHGWVRGTWDAQEIDRRLTNPEGDAR